MALSVWEYAALSAALGLPIPRVAAVTGAMAACAAFVSPDPPLTIVLSAIVIAGGALAIAGGQPTRDLLGAAPQAA